MRQLEMAVTRLAPLGARTAWDAAIEALEARERGPYSPITVKWTVRSRWRMPSKSAK